MKITVHIDGRAHAVESGSSAAAAVLNAAGTPGAAFRRSVTGHPRGPICGMGICHECRVIIDGAAHERSCLVECREGMRIETSASAMSSEPPAGNDGPEWVHTHLETDVLILGGGPAGLAAAAVLAEHSVDTILLDENPAPGGQIWRRDVHPPHREPRAEEAIRSAVARATFLGSTSVWDLQEHECRAHCRAWEGSPGNEAFLRVRYRRLLLASGARERFLPFPGWTLPGVMGVGGAQALVKAGLDVTGLRVVVAGSGPLLPAVAASLRQHGARSLFLAEQAERASLLPLALSLAANSDKLVQGLKLRMDLAGVAWRFGTWPLAAEGTGQVRSVVMTNGQTEWREDCDLLSVGFGLVPSVESARRLGCRLTMTDGAGTPMDAPAVAVDPWQQTSIAGVYAAGEITGVGGVDLAEAEGRIAGLALAGELAAAEEHFEMRRQGHAFAAALAQSFSLRRELLVPPDDAVTICRCEDVSYGRVDSHSSWRNAKLATRCGMGSCQGRVCGTALQTLKGWKGEPPRPPLSPVPAEAWAEPADESSGRSG